jgi:hypothetical protein
MLGVDQMRVGLLARAQPQAAFDEERAECAHRVERSVRLPPSMLRPGLGSTRSCAPRYRATVASISPTVAEARQSRNA